LLRQSIRIPRAALACNNIEEDGELRTRPFGLLAAVGDPGGQAFYLPSGFSSLRETWRFAAARGGTERLRIAYAPADYDLFGGEGTDPG